MKKYLYLLPLAVASCDAQPAFASTHYRASDYACLAVLSTAMVISLGFKVWYARQKIERR